MAGGEVCQTCYLTVSTAELGALDVPPLIE
jgi:hypothetical protein